MQELNDMNNLKHKSLCFSVRWEKNIKKIIAYNYTIAAILRDIYRTRKRQTRTIAVDLCYKGMDD